MAPRSKTRNPVIPKLEAPETFVDLFDGLDDAPEHDLVPEPLATLFGQHAVWLKAQKMKRLELTGEKDVKSRRKGGAPLEDLLEKYRIGQPQEQHKMEETPAPNRRQEPAPPQTGTARKTRAGMLRDSQIKAEIESPVATPAPSVHAKTPMPQSVARVKEEFASPRKGHASPRKEIVARLASPRRAPAQKSEEDPKLDKYNKALERKQLQAAQKAEKLRKENEEKKKRVEAKRLQQEEEERRKRAEAIKKQEKADELRRQHMSPARSRVVSAMNTPSRMMPPAATKTPNNTMRHKLVFDNTPVRTPGRVPVKAAKLEHPTVGTSAAVNTNFESARREVKRKAVRPATATPQAEAPAQRCDQDDAAAVLRARQMRLLMGDDDGEEEERRQMEQRRAAEEEEEKRQKKELQMQRQAEEERMKRAEEERRRLAEEQRRAAEAEQKRREKEEAQRRRAAEEAAEEERLRKEEMARLQREKEAREEEELAQKLNESMLEDRDEEMEDGGEEQEQKHDASQVSSYDMTMEKVFLPSTADNYNIEDLDSGDETDDETAPRKQVPAWAEWSALTRLGLEQAKMPRDFDMMYGTMESPHTQPIFKAGKKPRRARGSSAQWNSPVSNPTKGKSRFLGI